MNFKIDTINEKKYLIEQKIKLFAQKFFMAKIIK
jgi:hypothetical protein